MSMSSYFWVSFWGFLLELLLFVLSILTRRGSSKQWHAHIYTSLFILLLNLLLGIMHVLITQSIKDEEMITILSWTISYLFFCAGPLLVWYVTSLYYYDHYASIRYYMLLVLPMIPVLILVGIFGPLVIDANQHLHFANLGIVLLFVACELYYFGLSVFVVKRYKTCHGKSHRIMIRGLLVMGLITYSVIYDTGNPSVFGACLALLSLYSSFTVQGPAYYFCTGNGLRNNNAYRVSVEMHLIEKRPFQLLLIHTENEREIELTESGELSEPIANILGKALKEVVTDKPLFMIRDGLYAVLIEQKQAEESIDILIAIREKLETTLKQNNESDKVRVHFCMLDLPACIDTYSDLQMAQQLFLNRENLKSYDLISEDDLEVREEINRRNEMFDVMEALNNGKIKAYYQPIVDYRKNRIVAGETLARFEKEDGSAESIGYLVPVMEKYGIVLQLDKRIIQQAMDFVASKECIDAGIQNLDVNLSIEETLQENTAEFIGNYGKRIGLDPTRLVIEVLESNDPNAVYGIQTTMRKLSKFGFYLSMDDFGTGYSNISRLLSYPTQIIKIDRSLLVEAMRSQIGEKVLASLVTLIHDLGKKIVVEGVETKEEEALVNKLSIDYGQGFLYAKAMKDTDFLAFVKQYNQAHVA